MLSKKLLVTFFAFLALVGVSSAALAARSDGLNSDSEFGNLSSVLLGGGYSADYADGMILFSNSEDEGKLYLRNVKSGSVRKIENESAWFINVIGRDIYYISSDGSLSYIVKTNLNSEREILAESKTGLSNLFVSAECMYYLCGDSVVQHRFSDGTESVIFSNSQMKAFVPDEGDIYWLKEKPVLSQSHKSQDVDAYEGIEEENLIFDCFLYDAEHGTSIPASYAEAIQAYSDTDYADLEDLALSVRVGEKTIPTEEYPVGSYFTDSGTPCTDHGTGVCGWENESLCNCKAFHNGVSLKAVQCYGYARYIYNYCFDDLGFSDSEKSSNLGSLEKGTVTEESFKALIQQAKPGAHLRVQYIKATGVSVSAHSMIILDWNESGFSVCEANADGKCGVSVRRLDYSSFVPTVVSVSFLMMPDNYPGFTEETTGSPVGTPGDAESTTSFTDVPSETESSSESAVATQPVGSETVSLISEVLLTLVRVFVDCLNIFIKFLVALI